MSIYSTQRYWFSDGLAEIGVGVGFLLTGGVLLSIGSLPTVTLKVLAMPLTGLLISLVFPSLISAVRSRWLNKTSVEPLYRSSLRSQVIGVGILLPVVGWLAINVAALGDDLTGRGSLGLWCITIGLFFSLVPLLWGFVSGMLRFYLVAIPVIGSGVAAAYWTLSIGASTLLVWFVTGVCFLVSGTIALIVFQRRTGS